MRKTVIILLLAAALAAAQKLEVGATASYGSFSAEDLRREPYAIFGAEICAFCSGRFALFGEYSLWTRTGGVNTWAHIYTGLLAGAGLRIQGKGRVRPFFDVGAAGGQDRYEWGSAGYAGRNAHNLGGMVLGGGVSIPLGKGFYIRPQARFYALTGMHFAAGTGVGVGYRF
jgi:hypothetical protein